jgi:glycogen operon protein
VLTDVKLIAEPWDVGPGGYQLGHFPAPWSEWNDRYRDTVREVWLADSAGKHGSGVRDLAYRLSGSSDVFEPGGKGPLASVNFVTAHDGFTLRDLVTYERKHNEPNGEDSRDGSDNNRSWNCGVEGPSDDPAVRALRRRMMRNLLSTLLVSTGVPMLTAGDETGRTQQGNNNAYSVDAVESDSPAGRPAAYPVDWNHDDEARDLLAWTRALLALRRTHPVLRQAEFFDGRPAHDGGLTDLAWFAANGTEMTPDSWFDHDQRVLGLHLAADFLPEGGSPASLLVLLNTGPEAETFVLPGPPWSSTYRPLLDTTDEHPGTDPDGSGRPDSTGRDDSTSSAGSSLLGPGAAVPLSPHSLRVLAAGH